MKWSVFPKGYTLSKLTHKNRKPEIIKAILGLYILFPIPPVPDGFPGAFLQFFKEHSMFYTHFFLR